MLTRSQIDSFHANGFLIMRGLFRGPELALLREAAESVVREGAARQGYGHAYHQFPDGREVYWRSERMWQRYPIFRAATVHPELLENIGQCIGRPFYPWNDSLVVKLPHSGAPVKWHQDPPYRNPDREFTFPIPNFTTDIYLDRSWPGNGCVYAIPAHHLVGHVDLSDKSDEELFTKHGAVPLEMEPGDALFHALSTPHGSGPNPTSTTRRVFYVHYLAEEVYQDGYSSEPWAREKPGWAPTRRAELQSMIRDRKELALDASSPSIRLGSEGFEFHGDDSTPHRHWETLAAQIPPAERDRMKRLGGLTP